MIWNSYLHNIYLNLFIPLYGSVISLRIGGLLGQRLFIFFILKRRFILKGDLSQNFIGKMVLTKFGICFTFSGILKICQWVVFPNHDFSHLTRPLSKQTFTLNSAGRVKCETTVLGISWYRTKDTSKLTVHSVSKSMWVLGISWYLYQVDFKVDAPCSFGIQINMGIRRANTRKIFKSSIQIWSKYFWCARHLYDSTKFTTGKDVGGFLDPILLIVYF